MSAEAEGRRTRAGGRPAPVPAHLERAGAVSRFAAFFGDAVVVTVVLRGGAWLLRASAHALRRFAPPMNLDEVLLACVPLVAAAYLLAFWIAGGQTPGKWLLGIRIVPVGGGRLSARRALVRLVGYVLSALPCYGGYLLILGPERRGLHDRLARTEVRYVRGEAGARRERRAGGLGDPLRVPV
jgi:uncharacterized RDD family membrane protein YckC